MGATRPTPKAPEGAARFPLEQARGRLAIPLEPALVAAEVTHGIAALAAAHQSPLVVVAAHAPLASPLRSARNLGMEPRVLAPSGQPGIPARLTLSLPLRGALGPSARTAAVAFVAGFASASRADGAATPSGGQLADAIGRKVTQLGTKFSFELLASELASTPAAKQAPALPAALSALHEAEQEAAVYSTPVPWSRVLAPSPRGRPAAVWLDLSSLGPEGAAQVGGLALASLAATAPEWSPALSGHPPVLLAQGVESRVGVYALERLLGPSPPAPLFGLLVEGADRGGDGLALPGVSSALHSRDGLTFEGVHGQLPLVDPAGGGLALTASEREALTPHTLRQRMVGEEREEEAEPGASDSGGAPSVRGRASSDALERASGDLSKIARTGIAAPKRATKGRPTRSDYEARDFEL